MRLLLSVILVTTISVSAHATLVTFDLTTGPAGDLTSHPVMQDGVTLLIDNPNGNILFDPPGNVFRFILGGLFIDGGLAPNLDFTFSENVRLVNYTIANDDGGIFDLTQGGLQSLGQSLSIGTFAFANVSDVFLGNQAIALTHNQHDGSGFSISAITVDTVAAPEPTTLALMGLGLAGLGYTRRKTA